MKATLKNLVIPIISLAFFSTLLSTQVFADVYVGKVAPNTIDSTNYNWTKMYDSDDPMVAKEDGPAWFGQRGNDTVMLTGDPVLLDDKNYYLGVFGEPMDTAINYIYTIKNDKVALTIANYDNHDIQLGSSDNKLKFASITTMGGRNYNIYADIEESISNRVSSGKTVVNGNVKNFTPGKWLASYYSDITNSSTEITGDVDFLLITKYDEQNNIGFNGNIKIDGTVKKAIICEWDENYTEGYYFNSPSFHWKPVGKVENCAPGTFSITNGVLSSSIDIISYEEVSPDSIDTECYIWGMCYDVDKTPSWYTYVDENVDGEIVRKKVKLTGSPILVSDNKEYIIDIGYEPNTSVLDFINSIDNEKVTLQVTASTSSNIQIGASDNTRKFRHAEVYAWNNIVTLYADLDEMYSGVGRTKVYGNVNFVSAGKMIYEALARTNCDIDISGNVECIDIHKYFYSEEEGTIGFNGNIKVDGTVKKAVIYEWDENNTNALTGTHWIPKHKVENCAAGTFIVTNGELDSALQILPYENEPQTHEHKWDVEYAIDKAATCEEAGSKSIHCADCSEKKNVTKIEPLDHSWNEGEITKEATYTEKGVKTFKCTREGCGKTKTEDIPTLDPLNPVPTVPTEPDKPVIIEKDYNLGLDSIAIDTAYDEIEGLVKTDIAKCNLKKPIKDQTYTGKGMTPATVLTISDETGKSVVLTEGTDYVKTYSDNIQSGTAKIVISGNGLYKGEKTFEFTINPKSVSKLNVVMSSVTTKDSLDSINDKILVYDGTKLLTENKDYTVDKTGIILSSAGKKNISIKGIGNYKDEKKGAFTAIELKEGEKLLAGASLSDEAKKKLVYSGKAIKLTTADIIAKDANGNILDSANYTVTSKNTLNAGVGLVTVKAKGKGYKGSVVIPVEIIAPAFTMIAPGGIKDIVYNGKLRRQKVKVTSTVNGKTVTLKQNKDYVISYKNNLHAGKATAVITGIGNFANSGEIEVSFNIKQLDIKKAAIKKDKATNTITSVTFNKHTLVNGVDYAVGVATSAGKVPVTGLRDFTGTIEK